jgi:hypothetical protein
MFGSSLGSMSGLLPLCFFLGLSIPRPSMPKGSGASQAMGTEDACISPSGLLLCCSPPSSSVLHPAAAPLARGMLPLLLRWRAEVGSNRPAAVAATGAGSSVLGSAAGHSSAMQTRNKLIRRGQSTKIGKLASLAE